MKAIRNYVLRSRFANQSMAYHAEHDKKNYLILCGEALIRANNGVVEASVIEQTRMGEVEVWHSSQ
jgi:hypothetical protein